METGLSELKELFELKDRDLRTYSPLTLAYIGDGVYELVIRTILVKKGNCPVNQLHKKASSLVKAGAQSKMMELLEPDLTEEELAVYKRGRNAHSPTMAKHATMADYRRATGFEALMGYLYLKEDYSRIVELVRKGIPEETYVYFVHSYYLQAEELEIVKATAQYGVTIHASVEKDNIFACQFHPEKSSKYGLKILENFAKLGKEA